MPYTVLFSEDDRKPLFVSLKQLWIIIHCCEAFYNRTPVELFTLATESGGHLGCVIGGKLYTEIYRGSNNSLLRRLKS